MCVRGANERRNRREKKQDVIVGRTWRSFSHTCDTTVNLSSVCEAQALCHCPNALGATAKLFRAAKFVLCAQCAGRTCAFHIGCESTMAMTTNEMAKSWPKKREKEEATDGKGARSDGMCARTPET